MAHYAFIDDNNLVTEVIVGRDEDDLVEGVTSWEDYYGAVRGQRCLQTSYNTRAGQHLLGGTPFRGNFAGIGMLYDETLNAFIDSHGLSGWVFNESTYSWEPPVAKPDEKNRYFWDEQACQWVEA